MSRLMFSILAAAAILAMAAAGAVPADAATSGPSAQKTLQAKSKGPSKGIREVDVLRNTDVVAPPELRRPRPTKRRN
jgi:hypothetical protein